MLLQVNGLKTSFYPGTGKIEAVDGISFGVKKGESLGIVGESGCGKSVAALSIMQLIRKPGVIESGEVLYRGSSLLQNPWQLKHIRGNRMSMVFQDPMTALNPVLSVGRQISEVLERHKSLRRKEAMAKAVELMEKVGIPQASRRAADFPHRFSGGMRQRVMIAMALACGPELLIADEPTTALDVTIQAQILDLIRRLREENGMAVMMITHDLGVVAEMTERVLVMYAGRIVEEAPVGKFFGSPAHPYSIGLLAAMPYFADPRKRLFTIRGAVHDGRGKPPGCLFSPRCDGAESICFAAEPPLTRFGEDRSVRCWKAGRHIRRG